MFAVPEDVSSYSKAHLDSVMKFADATTAAAEQWFDLNVKSAKAASAEALKQLRALATAKDVQELSSLQTTFSQANADKLQGYLRALQTWATDTHGELSKVVETEVNEINKSIAKLDDGKMVKFLDIGPKFLDADGTTLPKDTTEIVHA